MSSGCADARYDVCKTVDPVTPSHENNSKLLLPPSSLEQNMYALLAQFGLNWQGQHLLLSGVFLSGITHMLCVTQVVRNIGNLSLLINCLELSMWLEY